MPARRQPTYAARADVPVVVLPAVSFRFPHADEVKMPGGFFQVSSELRPLLATLKGIEPQVYLLIGIDAYARNQWKTVVKQSDVAAELFVTEKTVREAIHRLADIGMIHLGRRTAEGTEVQIMVPEAAAQTGNPLPVQRPATGNGLPVERHRNRKPITGSTGNALPVRAAHIRNSESSEKQQQRAADADVVALLEGAGIKGKNLADLGSTVTRQQAEDAIRHLRIEQLRGTKIDNPAGWLVDALKAGYEPPLASADNQKDRLRDQEARTRRLATPQGRQIVEDVERLIPTLSDAAFFDLAKAVIADVQNETDRDHFLRNPTPTNYMLCERVAVRFRKQASNRN